ncbi:MAG: hypothetical protein ABIF01_05555 [Candidatus Micrarchaeota archaeon]
MGQAKIDYIHALAFVSLVFLVLGLSPLSRSFSIFSFFEPEVYFIPQYMPYVVSIVSAYAGLRYLKESNSKVFIAAMGGVFKANIVISAFMVIYFVYAFLLVYFGQVSIPEYCVMSDTFGCQSVWLSSEDNFLYFSLVNSYNPLVVTYVSCSHDKTKLEKCDASSCRGYDSNRGGVSVQSSSTVGFKVICEDENGNPVKFERGDYYAGKLVIGYNYASEPTSAVRKTIGSITARAE